jgi:hypothetical protein
MVNDRYILTDIKKTDPLSGYFYFKGMEFDFIPDAQSVPLVDVIAERIKGKDNVYLIVNVMDTLTKLFEQKSQFNNFETLSKQLTLILYQDELTQDMVLTASRRPDMAKWINSMKPIVLLDGKAGRYLNENFNGCEFVNDLFIADTDGKASGRCFPEVSTFLDHRPIKDFLFLSRKKPNRPFRSILFQRMEEEGLTESAICNFKPHDGHTHDDLGEMFPGDIIESPLRFFIPPYKWYNQTNFELVAETLTLINNDDTFFLTEKTTRPICMKHPFMVLGNFHHMKNLRELGFQTFSEHLDESYDEEQDVEKRIKIIVDNLKDIKGRSLKLYHDTEAIREHNFKHYLYLIGSHTTRFWKTLDDFWRNH